MTAFHTENLSLLASAPNGIRRLRELILELGVTGRLVAQDMNDESGQDLLVRIGKLHASSMKGKQTKSSSFERNELPDQLPTGWAAAQLGDVVEIVRGITFPASEKTKAPAPGRIACLRTANVQDRVEWDDLLYVGEEFVAREDQVLQVSDIVMSMANSRELVGKVALVAEIPVEKASFGGFLGVIRPILMEPRFVMALLRTPVARRDLIDGASQTTNIANISLAKLRPLPVAVPPLAEQHRIVAKVDELMALCDRLEARQQDAEAAHARLVQALLDSLTQARDVDEFQACWQRLALCFESVLTNGESVEAFEAAVFDLAARGVLTRRESDDEPATLLLSDIAEYKTALSRRGLMRDAKSRPPIGGPVPFDLPNTWCWARWDDVALKIGDIDHKMPEPDPNGVPFVSPRDFYPGNVIDFEGAIRVARADYERLSSKIRAESGDLIYPRYGTIGENVLVTVDREFLVSYSCAVIKVARGFVEPEYQFFVSLSGCIRRQAKAAENKTTQANVGIKSIQEFLFPLPPLAEQRRIVAKVTELLGLCDQLKARIAAARAKHAQLAEALVAQAVTVAA